MLYSPPFSHILPERGRTKILTHVKHRVAFYMSLFLAYPGSHFLSVPVRGTPLFLNILVAVRLRDSTTQSGVRAWVGEQTQRKTVLSFLSGCRSIKLRTRRSLECLCPFRQLEQHWCPLVWAVCIPLRM